MVSDIKRLHKITLAELEEWRQERARVGQLKYGDWDTKRYNLVDVVEELLDALNILERFENRARVQGLADYNQQMRLRKIKDDVFSDLARVRNLDELLPDELCTDENGGERIWWGDHK
jgi:hypothetical protein